MVLLEDLVVCDGEDVCLEFEDIIASLSDALYSRAFDAVSMFFGWLNLFIVVLLFYMGVMFRELREVLIIGV